MTGWVSPNHLTQGISVGIWQMCVAYRMSTWTKLPHGKAQLLNLQARQQTKMEQTTKTDALSVTSYFILKPWFYMTFRICGTLGQINCPLTKNSDVAFKVDAKCDATTFSFVLSLRYLTRSMWHYISVRPVNQSSKWIDSVIPFAVSLSVRSHIIYLLINLILFSK